MFVVNGMPEERVQELALPLGSVFDSAVYGCAADTRLIRSSGITTCMAADMLTDSADQLETAHQREGILLGSTVWMMTRVAALAETEAIMAPQREYDLELTDNLDFTCTEVTFATGRTGVAANRLNDHLIAAGRFAIDRVSGRLVEARPATESEQALEAVEGEAP